MQEDESPIPARGGRSRPIPVQEDPVTKRGCGRPRKEPIPPSPASESEPDPPSSPLARISARVRGYWLRSQGGTTPQSPASASASSHASSEQLIFDLELDDDDNIEVPPAHHRTTSPTLVASPASTQFIAETPLAQLLSQQQQQQDQRHFDDDDDDTPDAANSVHFAVHADPAVEIQRLRQSRAQLAQNLEKSTDHVNRLHARLLVYAGDQTARTAELGQVRLGRQNVIGKVERSKGTGDIASRVFKYGIAFVMMLALLCLLWAWINGPESAYIRRRRAEVLCE